MSVNPEALQWLREFDNTTTHPRVREYAKSILAGLQTVSARPQLPFDVDPKRLREAITWATRHVQFVDDHWAVNMLAKVAQHLLGVSAEKVRFVCVGDTAERCATLDTVLDRVKTALEDGVDDLHITSTSRPDLSSSKTWNGQ